MDYVIVICGFFGAWFLVAGPVLQAALELREQEYDREGIDAVTSSVPAPPKISAWWWLLPPVAYFMQYRRNKAHRDAIMRALAPAQLEQTVVFLNKANGWFIVGGGGFLIAVKETWELVEQFEWPFFLFWVLIVVAFLVCVGNVVARMGQTDKALGREQHRPGRAR